MTTASLTVIGAGAIGSAVANLGVKAGADVQILVRDTAKAAVEGATVAELGAPITGEIVVLALPYGAISEVVASYGADAFAGRVVVDPSNPVDFQTFDSVVAPGTSAASELAAALPGARVVKAFNTNFAGTLASGVAGGRPTTVSAASDSDEAKQALRGLVEAAGLAFVDAGALKRAERLEALGALQIEYAITGATSWMGGFVVAE